MLKKTLSIAIVLAGLLALSGTAYAGHHDTGGNQSDGPSAPIPDSCTTSALLAGAAGGLGLLRRYLR